MNRALGSTLLWVLAATASPLMAAVPSLPVSVQMQMPVAGPRILEQWATDYYSNRWHELVSSIESTLTSANGLELPLLEGCDTAARHEFDFGRNTYRILFVSAVQDPEGDLVALVLAPGDEEPYSSRLPGIDQFFDVFLHIGEPGEIHSEYNSTAVANPVLEKLPSFVKQVDLGGIARLVRDGPEGVQPMLYLQISRVDLPFSRASISVKDAAKIPAPFDSAKISSRAGELETSLNVREAGGAPCARRVASCLRQAVQAELLLDKVAIGNALKAAAKKENCPDGDWTEYDPPEEKCGKPIIGTTDREKCYLHPGEGSKARCLAEARIESVYASVASKDAACTAATMDDFAAATKVESSFKKLVQGKAVEAKAESVYSNVPQSYISLGVLAGVLGDTGGDGRYKLDSGKISADPVTGTLSMAILNFHPWGYNPKSERLSWGERSRLFVGAVLTPEFGLGAGVGVSLVKGLSVNFGYAWMRVDTTRGGDAAGGAPSNLKDPFRNGVARSGFFGFSYAF